ncbi:MAG: hypothetical protein Kow00122_10860 [Thermoleophilia bacterium]
MHEEMRALMESRGWSPIELATVADTTPATVSRYLKRRRGMRVDPKSVRTYRKFERAFGLPEGYSFEEQLHNAELEVRQLVWQGPTSLEALELLIEGTKTRRRHDEES